MLVYLDEFSISKHFMTLLAVIIMNGTSHASYSYLIFTCISIFIFGRIPNGGLCVLALAMGIFPDIDGIIWAIRNPGKKTETSFQHHLMYPTHWPVTYTPLVAWTVFAFWFNIIPMQSLAITLGIYAHLMFDSISCGDGMNWGSPWGHHFINLFSSTTDGYHGLYWNARFRKTVFFKLGNIAAIGSIMLLVLFAPFYPADLGWYIFAVAGLSFIVITGFKGVPAKYSNEPPEGRYHDYRRLPKYHEHLSQKMKDRIRSWQETHPANDHRT